MGRRRWLFSLFLFILVLAGCAKASGLGVIKI